MDPQGFSLRDKQPCGPGLGSALLGEHTWGLAEKPTSGVHWAPWDRLRGPGGRAKGTTRRPLSSEGHPHPPTAPRTGSGEGGHV